MNTALDEPRLEVSWGRQIWTAFMMCAVLFPVVGPITAIYVAGPEMAVSIGADQTELTWIIDSYTLGLAVTLLPAGALGDRFGRRGVMMIGLAVYIGLSFGPLFADDPTLLIALRVLMGMAAGAMMPSTLSIITSVFPPDRRERAVGLWAGCVIVHGAIAIIAAGTILELASWRAVFVFFLALAALLLVLSATVPTSAVRNPPRLDGAGAVLSAGAVGLVVFALIEGPNLGWTSGTVLGCFVAGVLMAVLFVLVELRRDEPLLDVRLFTNRTFSVATLGLLLQFTVLFVPVVAGLLYTIFIAGYSPLVAGLAGCPVTFLLMPLSAFVTAKHGLRLVLTIGFACTIASGAVLLFVDAEGTYWPIALSLMLVGAGAGVCTGPATTAVLDAVPPEKQGVASAINHTTREVGTALGLALCGSMMSAGYLRDIRPATEDLPEPAREASRESVAGARAVAEQLQNPQLDQAAREAFAAGVHQTAIALMAVAAVAFAVFLIWAPGKPMVPLAASGVSGRISDPAGRGLAATVTLTDLTGAQVAHGTADATGAYRFEVPAGRYLMVVVADPLPPQARVLAVGAGPLRRDVGWDVGRDVAAAGRLAGVVRSVGTAEPVADAQVALAGPGGVTVVRTVTGSDGAFRFDGLATGTYTLTAAGHRSATTPVRIGNGHAGEVEVTVGTEVGVGLPPR